MKGMLARLAAVAAVVVALGGCIISSYDIAADVAPQFPLTAKAYRDADGKVATFSVAGGAYLVRDSRGEERQRVRFFKIPEYDGYIFQVVPADKHLRAGETGVMFGYYPADVTANGFVVHEWKADVAAHLPAHVAALVTVDKDGNLTLKDPRRDTLYVIREMIRARLPTRLSIFTAAAGA